MALDMTTALTIKANVVGDAKLDGLQRSLGGIERQGKKTATAMDRLKTASSTLTGVLARLGAAAATAGFIRSGIEADRTANRLANLTKEFGETEKVQKLAAQAASTFGLSQVASQSAVADLFGRLRPMGIELKDIETVFLGVNTAAARMNLTTADTEGVMLQLSQALGSGKLQGDEFRSIMERLPAIGQAVATSLGVDVAQLKELSSQGQITTEVIIKALGDLAKQEPPPPDAYKRFTAAVQDLSTAIGTQLLPALTPVVRLATSAIRVFNALPGPLKTIAASVVALGAGLVVVAPAIPAIVSAFQLLVGLKIGATIAGYAPVIVGVIGSLKTLGAILLGVFTGPVGWVALAAAAGVALFAFRDRIAQAFSGLVSAIRAPFEAIAGFIRGIFNGVIAHIESRINFAIGALNGLINIANRALRALGFAGISNIPNVNLPRFADGGVVNGPTVAMVGEGGEPEYIIPQSKMARAAANYLGGMRGKSVIPAFANGGVVGPGAATGGTSGGAANTTVQITTGPVLQQDGQNYVTVGDLERALKSFGNQVFRNSRTVGGRRYQGIYA